MAAVATDLAEAALADANFFESIREHARWQDPCDYVEADGLILLAGCTALPVSYWNCVARTDPQLPADEMLARARAFFRPHGRKFNVFVRSSWDDDVAALLQAEGFKQSSEPPCMVIDAALAERPAPAGVRIEALSEPHHVADAARVCGESYAAFGLPPREVHALFAQAARVLSSQVVGFVAYRGEQPVSTALTILNGECAGVYWVGTAPDAQRMGLADTCTRLATNAGFARGARLVTLQASPFGEPIYRRLGYRTYGRLRSYR